MEPDAIEAEINRFFGFGGVAPDAMAHHRAIETGAKHFVAIILLHAPKCADQSAAIRKVREAMMTASAAIALEGRV